MAKVFDLFILLTICILNLPIARSKYCDIKYTETHKYSKKCNWGTSFGRWFRCTKYKVVDKYKKGCCQGWTGSGCQKAICGGKVDPGACNRNFPDSHIVLANKNIDKNSGGTCNEPNKCICDKDGFYSVGTHCDICSPINNCDLEYCTTKTDQLCHRCEGFVANMTGRQAYIRSLDHKLCTKACSWRPDSSRCFPGTCQDDLYSNCNCSDGFTGNHCEKIIAKPEMMYNEVTLTAENGEFIQTPEDINSAQPEPISWTNLLNPVSIDYKFQSQFIKPNPDPRHAFIMDFKAGIIHGQITFTKKSTPWKWVEVPVNISVDGNVTYNNSIDTSTLNMTDITDAYCELMGMNGTEFVMNETTNMLMNKTDLSINRLDFSRNETGYNITDTNITCSIWVWTQVNVTETQTDICSASAGRDDPNQAVFACNKRLETNFSQEFLHQDRLEVNISIVAGGFVKLTNFETEKNETHYFESSTLQHTYEIRFDNVPPYHCQPVLDCGKTMLYDIDASNQTENILSWDGWMDDDGGIGVYEIEVLSLKQTNDTLVIDTSVQNHVTTSNNLTFYLTTPDAYAIIFTAKDKAGNTQTARRILVFDDSSNISTTHSSRFLATSALTSTNYTWQQNHGPVDIDWENRYINTKHHNGKYLAGVGPYQNLSSEYDDYYGTRTVEPVDNILGIVRYETYYGKDDQGGSTIQPTDVDFTSIGNLNQSITISPTIQDGDTIKFYIRAYDIVDSYLEESTTVYFDMSPPVIKDLWLTKGDDLNIAVHGFQDFDQLVIEWMAYDLHSGLETVEWKLYDNFTDDVILHGSQHIPVQGGTQTLSACEEKYQKYSRGSDCYCTPAVGCYHQHFQVKPGVSLEDKNGLIQGKHRGVHDYDYYIEVNVMNNAKLNTTLTYKITIDTSPPHVGAVHDGKYGEPEVDYQPDRTLHAHWEGFFDKESGVRYYHYSFSTKCLIAEDFHFEIQNTPEINETEVTHATWLAPTDGQYYITVVAYNAALEPSQAVCSDGVVIDSTRPTVSEIFIDQARIEAGLVSKDGMLYYINNKRQIHQIQNPNADCLQRGRPIEDISLFPVERYPNQTIQDKDLCQEETLPIKYLTQSYLVEHSHIYVNWTGIDVESGIYDYQFGLSTEKDSKPDLLPFHSTNHHAWYRGHHPQLTDGTEFYIHIKAINKAGQETIQILGPLIVHTSKPKFTGKIDIVRDNNIVIADWSKAVVKDPGHSRLKYTTSIGTTKGGQEINMFSRLNFNDPCVETTPPTCTAFDILKLHWGLHHGYEYYISIKIENTVGLHTVISSEPFTYKSLKPSKGVVIDVGLKSELDYFNILELEDSDYQLSTSMVSVRWYGFESEEGISSDIKYEVGIKKENSNEFLHSVHVSQQTKYTFNGLQLQLYQKYIVSVTARITGGGSVTSSSDGVTVIKVSEDLSAEVELKDGAVCLQPTTLQANHYYNSTGTYCGEYGYQPSSSSYSINWNISSKYHNLYPHVKWSLQKQHQNTDIWLKEYEKELYTRDSMLTLPYRLEVCESYRSQLQFCIDNVCSKPVHSEGVTILGKPDKPKMDILLTTDQEMNVSLEFTQTSESCNNIIQRLEWSITDNHNGRLYTLWKKVEAIVNNNNKIQLKINLDGKINSNKCRRLALRLFNKAGLSTLISKQIQNCSGVDPILIRPAIVVDAVRQVDRNGIKLEKNAGWNEPDVDYTPYNDIISAVWPTLRHRNYTWGLLQGPLQTTSTLYSNPDIIVSDPCPHPSTIICGQTDKEYINIKPLKQLIHGKRYHVCLHADSTTLQHEKWTEDLEEINSCSDGVAVDLSPPSGGRVWIQTDTNTNYQVSINTLVVFWDSFIDVEEEGGAVHPSGISHYITQIGSSSSISDVVSPVNVGLINHQVFHNLTLQNGHQYFATVTAVDFVNQKKSVVSDGIIVDHTAPEITQNRIQIPSPYLNSLDTISACWTGNFKDSESGIKFYQWSVGSRRGQTDVSNTIVTVDDCVEAALDVKLQDGFTYYINVQAINGVGMSTMLVSRPLIVETTPPITGLVFDGISGDNNIDDIDYISNTLPPTIRWERFHDPHSSIKHYSVQLGTCLGCDDVLLQTETGTSHNFTFTNIRFIPGTKYFTMVTGCNMAELCSSISTDGFVIDITPPIRGHVMDGTRDADVDFQASRTYIGGKWYGFKDSESSIEKYEWRVGTSKGGSEILKPETLPVTEITYISNLPLLKHLPVGIPIYITVTAYNKAGLISESTSDGFIIDTTPPTVTKQTTLSSTFASIVPSTIICRTGFKVEWEFTDEESDIEHQYISLSPHILGDFNSSTIEIPSVLTEYIFYDLSLHDGSKYKVKVIGCNLAGLCASSISEDILVDTTPPTRGTFAIESNHAANIIRHPGRWIEWNTTSLTIAWIGFSDLHSGIQYYLVSVGTKPFYTDLNKDGEAVKYFHEDGRLFENEGEVQIKTVETAGNLDHGMSVFLSIVAINGVGLKSQPIHNEFQLIHADFRTNNHGSLVRRCRPYNCEGHCVCSEQDKICSKPDGCIVNDSDIKLIQVMDVIDLQSTETIQSNYTPTDMFVSAKWKLTTNTDSAIPIRYDVSIGLSDKDQPSGVFNTVEERHWFDVGHDMTTIIPLPKGKTLHDNIGYSIFVRAWYDYKQYCIYKSPGITVISSPPSLTYFSGVAVKELEQKTSSNDIDYQINNNTIIVGWKNKFKHQHVLDYYQVYISTHPQGHNIHKSHTKLSAQQKLFIISDLKLEENKIYYSTVLAYNKAGLCSWSTSDGIEIDATPPSTGVVHDGLGPHDSEYQSSDNLLAAAWYGFSDIGSGIVNYNWCVGTQNDSTTCDVLQWTNVGLKIIGSANSFIKLKTGDTIYHKVYAVDGSGLQSQVVVSNGIIIDTSPPEQSYLEFIGDNLILNPSFESVSDDTTDSCKSNIPEHWSTDSQSCVKTRSSQHSTAHDGEVYITVTDQIQQTIQNLDTDSSYQLTVHVGYPHDRLLSHHMVEGFIKLGHEINSFKLNPDLCQGDCSQHVNVIHWYKFTYIHQPINTRENLVIGTTRNNMILAVDDIELRKINHLSLKDTNNKHIEYHATFTPNWSSLHFNWYFKDSESSIVEYQWALGTVKGGTQIREFTTTGDRNHVTISNLQLVHNTRLYVTVTARNGAGLISVSYSDYIIVDTTPPVVNYIHDGTGRDVDYQTGKTITVNWKIEDPESGIDYFLWAIGSVKGGSDIQKFTRIQKDENRATIEYTEREPIQVYSTIRCYNKIGLQVTVTTDGVQLIDSNKLITSSGQITLLPQTTTQYQLSQYCLSLQHSLGIHWQFDSNSYSSTSVMVGLSTDAYKLEKEIDETGINYDGVKVLGLKLKPETNYFVNISGSLLGRLNNYINQTFSTYYQPPTLKDGDIKIAKTLDGLTLMISWTDVFVSQWKDLTFEVSLGTNQGSGDVLQWQETKDDKLRLTLPKQWKYKYLYLTLTAIDPCGLFTNIQKTIVL